MFGVKKRVLSLGLFLIIVGAAWFFLKDVITLEALQEGKASLKAFVTLHYNVALLIYVGVYSLSAAVAFPLGGVFVIASGLLFGTVIGALATVLASTLGGIAVFFIARYGFKDWIEEHHGKYLAPIEKEVSDHPISYLLFLRLMPVVPYLVINVVAALVNVRLSTFIWTSVVGLLPGAFLLALVGQEISRIAETGEILTSSVVLVLFLLALASLMPLAYTKYRKYRLKNNT
jgi:uncharacterized membrane protein YdjX (TVP38/TMEM64 family)